MACYSRLQTVAPTSRSPFAALPLDPFLGGQRRQVAHPTSSATSYSPAHPHTPDNTQERVGGLCSVRQRKGQARELGGEGGEVPPSGKRPRKWPSQGPPAAVGERYLTAGLGWPLGRTWPTAKAFAFLCVDPTQRSETGQVRGLRWHNRPREWEGKECGEADGHCGLRRERPREGKGK